METPDLSAAKRVQPVFAGARLIALRELLGQSQAEVAAAVGISPSALSQAERGDTTLSVASIKRVSDHLGVKEDALAEQPPLGIEMKPQFRHLRRTPAREQRKAERFVVATARVATILRDLVHFRCEPFAVSRPINPQDRIDDSAEQIEDAAAATRAKLGFKDSEPIGSNLLAALEEGGVTVVRDRETSRDIDAYSAVVDKLPIIVLDGGTGSVWDRDNFNLAHELGHIVMHQGIDHTPGTRTVEAQAHRFAGAFLGPAEPLRDALPRDLDWDRYLELKREWGMSIAALVERARELEVIDAATRTRAMKLRSAYGWRLAEPGANDRTLPEPRYLRRAMAAAKISLSSLRKRAHLPEAVVLRIVGPPKPSLG